MPFDLKRHEDGLNIRFLSIEDFRQPSGMIIMSMAQEDLPDCTQVFIKSKGVCHDGTTSSGVKEVVSPICLNKCREPVFA
jgi:hypothetical protein